MIEVISVAAYAELAEECDVQETIMLGGRWPLSIGQHPDLGQIALLHVGDLAALITPPPADLVVGVGGCRVDSMRRRIPA